MLGMGLAMSCPAGGFQPTQLPGCVLWLRADLGITLNSGNVSAWADQSGQGNNVTQSTASDQPAFASSTSSFGGQPSLSFNGTSDFIGSGSFAVNQPDTVYVAVHYSGDTTQRQLFDVLSGNTRQYVYTGAGNSDWLEGALGTDINSSSNASTAILCATYNGAGSGSAIYVNNSQTPGGQGAGTAGTSNLSTLSIGAYGPGPSNFFQGNVAEFVVYNSAHNATQRAQVMKYMGARYGVSVS